MIFSNPLQPIYDAFNVANECFKVTVRAVQVQQVPLLSRTQFLGSSADEAKTAIQNASKQASDLAIMALFATFERWIIDHLQDASARRSSGYPLGYSANLACRYEQAVERWRVEDILNLFKVEVDAELISQAQQIKK